MYKRSRLFVFTVLLSFSCAAIIAHAANQIFVNNVATTLASAITSTSQTSMIITSDTGFPTISGGDWVIATLVDSSGNKEIVKITAMTGTTCTIARGQESTTPNTFVAGSVVSLRLTAGPLTRYEELYELLGDADDYFELAVGGIELKTDIYPETDGAADLGTTSKNFGPLYANKSVLSESSMVSAVALLSSQSISVSTYTTIDFNIERFDTQAEFNTTTDIFTPNNTGYYFVSAQLKLGNLTDQTGYSAFIDVDGTDKYVATMQASGTAAQCVTVSGIVHLTSGSALKIEVLTGSACIVSSSTIGSTLTIFRVW